MLLQNSIAFKLKGGAPAAAIHGDKTAIFNCGFLGYQDTLFDAVGRHYFKNCYIQGGIDFIFGWGQSYFEVSHIYNFDFYYYNIFMQLIGKI